MYFNSASVGHFVRFFRQFFKKKNRLLSSVRGCSWETILLKTDNCEPLWQKDDKVTGKLLSSTVNQELLQQGHECAHHCPRCPEQCCTDSGNPVGTSILWHQRQNESRQTGKWGRKQGITWWTGVLWWDQNHHQGIWQSLALDRLVSVHVTWDNRPHTPDMPNVRCCSRQHMATTHKAGEETTAHWGIFRQQLHSSERLGQVMKKKKNWADH